MGRLIPEHFSLDLPISGSMAHLVMKVAQIGVGLEEVGTPAELKLRLEQLCIATEQAGAFVNIVNEWCGRMPWEMIDLIPTGVLLDAKANSRR